MEFVPPVIARNICSQIAGRELAIALCAMHILLIAAQLGMVTGAASALNGQVVYFSVQRFTDNTVRKICPWKKGVFSKHGFLKWILIWQDI